jgi:hypothetical protein
MVTRSKIRIIKRSERALRKEKPRTAEKSASSSSSDAVMTITGWIGELQQKKRAEAAAAVRVLKGIQVKAA